MFSSLATSQDRWRPISVHSRTHRHELGDTGGSGTRAGDIFDYTSPLPLPRFYSWTRASRQQITSESLRLWNASVITQTDREEGEHDWWLGGSFFFSFKGVWRGNMLAQQDSNTMKSQGTKIIALTCQNLMLLIWGRCCKIRSLGLSVKLLILPRL